MSHPIARHALARTFLFTALAVAATAAFAQDAVDLETVEVTSAKIPINLRDATVTVTVVDGADLRARGATDLRTALSLVAGVDVAPGGDNGPAGSVPALWGLREFDAFLLVVDGVPSGGAFNPALLALNLENVERIEVLKGAAPVSYGATSFVGVIHVIHRAAGEGPASIALGVGSRGSARASLALPLSRPGDRWQQSVLVDAEHDGLASDRAGWSRWHGLYRGAADVGSGHFTLDLDSTILGQQPVSPHPREGATLSDRVPLDANANPRGARQDESRTQLAFGYVVPTGLGEWTTRLSFAKTVGHTVRGFLRADFADDGITPNADGYQQDRQTREVYVDSHVATRIGDAGMLVWGVDHQYGNGDQHSANFEYAVRPDGSNAPQWQTLHIDESTFLGDRRNFSGVYGALDYAVTDTWRIDAGVRYNRTRETRTGQEVDLTGPSPVVGDRETLSRSDSRWTGALGTSVRLWQSQRDWVTAYANVRNSFKPAAIDFGPEAEPDILQPETARSAEVGLRGQQWDGRLKWDVSMFRMNFHNLVVAQDVGGLPGLTNAGNEHFKGAEAEVQWRLSDALSATGTWAWHDARFADYSQLFDGVPTQLDGHRLELSPAQLGGLGLLYSRPEGFRAYVTANHVGSRFLNKRNTSLAGAYNTLDAGVGFRMRQWEVRLDGTNLGDRRDPVAESELGESQYYRLPARSVWASVRYDFAND